MSSALMDFIAACLVMGVGIGTDVAIATALRAKQLNTAKIAIVWILGVSLTHTLFPMLGYLTTYFSIQVFPMLTPVVGIIAFLCISQFLYTEFKELASPEEEIEGKDKHFLVSFALILAVSWDALWSGPAKSAQVVGWSEVMIWGSFLLVGVMVAVSAVTSWYLGRWLLMVHNRAISNKAQHVALWMQYSIIAYFGLLALLRYTFQFEVQWWQILCLAASITFMVLQITIAKSKQQSHLNSIA